MLACVSEGRVDVDRIGRRGQVGQTGTSRPDVDRMVDRTIRRGQVGQMWTEWWTGQSDGARVRCDTSPGLSLSRLLWLLREAFLLR